VQGQALGPAIDGISQRVTPMKSRPSSGMEAAKMYTPYTIRRALRWA